MQTREPTKSDHLKLGSRSILAGPERAGAAGDAQRHRLY